MLDLRTILDLLLEQVDHNNVLIKHILRIKGLTFHDLRHTAATRMILSGANIVAISKILGHSDIKTTMRYAHPEDSLKDALESLGNFGKNTTKIATNENS